MKLGLYFRQAWYNLRVNRVYSAVFIAGTAVSVALVMAFLTVLSSRVVNTVPETHRDRMLSVSHLLYKGDMGTLGFGVSAEFGKRFLDSLPGVECWTAMAPGHFMEGPLTLRDAAGISCKAFTRFVDRNFWRVFDFQFVAGRPLSESGMHGSAVEMVVSESIARRLAGTSDAVGKEVYWDGRLFRICGVVRDVPISASAAFAEAWMPLDEYDINMSWFGRMSFGKVSFLGNGSIYILADDRASFRKIRSGIEDRLEIFNHTDDSGSELSLPRGVPSYVESMFVQFDIHDNKQSVSSYVWMSAGVLLLILLVPLFNLSGMVTSRMEARLTEFGTRKAFGAGSGSILSQITWENLLLTLIGGVLGLVLSWLLLEVFSRQLSMLIPTGGWMPGAAGYGTPEAGYFDFRDFYNIYLGTALLLVIVVLNVLSALLPARRVIRHPITESLNYKK